MAILSCLKVHKITCLRKNKSGKSILLLGRDSHKSAFDSLSLSSTPCDAVVIPCTILDEFGVSLGIDVDALHESILKYGDQIAGLILTRPTYQGVLSNSKTLTSIISLCHSHNIPVIVDEAHGAHLRFLDNVFITDALTCGADIVVQSTHKTLTSLSQTAMMHVGHGAFQFGGSADSVGEDSLQDLAVEVLGTFFSALTTTSPNSLLLASLDATRAQFTALKGVHQAGERSGRDMLAEAVEAADTVRDFIRSRYRTPHDRRSGGAITLLEDSLPQSSTLLVDPLRLNLRLHPLADPSGQLFNSIHMDDFLCERHGIYCELNLPECVTYVVSPGATLMTVAPLIEGLKDLFSTYSLRVDVSNTLTAGQRLLNMNSMGYLKASEGYWLTEKLPLDGGNDGVDVLVGRTCAETVSG
mmetsp:Transcript_21668/g.31085  ORF Transcript_21668/g.31085 Transcript_21668/m.31085 type:complete len:413 (-) Transcript_21668:246-1484(-)